jgi:hypothetical protein
MKSFRRGLRTKRKGEYNAGKLSVGLVASWSLVGHAMAGPGEDAVRHLLHSTFDKPNTPGVGALVNLTYRSAVNEPMRRQPSSGYLRERA